VITRVHAIIVGGIAVDADEEEVVMVAAVGGTVAAPVVDAVWLVTGECELTDVPHQPQTGAAEMGLRTGAST
jgi:hypothetical protein